jgi:hypothetical protein
MRAFLSGRAGVQADPRLGFHVFVLIMIGKGFPCPGTSGDLACAKIGCYSRTCTSCCYSRAG